MSNWIKRLFAGLSHTYTTAAETAPNKSESTSEINNENSGTYFGKYKDTDLCIHGDHEQGYMITFNKFQLCERQPTIADCERLLKTRNWGLMSALIIALAELVYLEHDIKKGNQALEELDNKVS